MKNYLQITISTYFRDWTYRNNTVIIPLEENVAKEMLASWRGNSGFEPSCFLAKYLFKNQNADVTLYIDGEIVGGINGMCQQDTREDYLYQEDEEDEED